MSGFVDKPFTRTKRFGFKVFWYKVSTLHSGFITFRIHDKTGIILDRIHVFCMCKHQKESGIKTSLICHESGNFCSSINESKKTNIRQRSIDATGSPLSRTPKAVHFFRISSITHVESPCVAWLSSFQSLFKSIPPKKSGLVYYIIP